MKRFFYFLSFFCFILPSHARLIDEPFPEVKTNQASIAHIKYIENQVKPLVSNKEELVKKISASFLNTPYVAHQLIGDLHHKEILVADLQALDCFTFIDYVEALKRAKNVSDFYNQLINIRYKGGQVSFFYRKHFFTDWANGPKLIAEDITKKLSPKHITVLKYLNMKNSHELYLPGIKVVERKVSYLPSNAVDRKVTNQLKTGDYIGAYTQLNGLDVSHVGIFINTPKGPVFRNASSRKENMKVVDTPFADYLKRIPGIVILRPKQ
jgi:hypothetical protein